MPFLNPAYSKILLAVSGGVDSVALADLFIRAGYHCVLLHCNFHLRGEESTRDEQFVTSLGDKYNVPVLVQHFDTEAWARQHKLSIQEAARKLRYRWFEEIVSNEALSIKSNTGLAPHVLRFTAIHLATAHHANDNIETLLINLFRGTGISGLHGIPATQAHIIRPLLFARRDEIMDYAVANGLHWVEDSSNASDKYTRNFIRHQVLPLAKEIFPNAEENLLQDIERFREAEELYNQAVTQYKKKLLQQKGNELHIPILKLQKSTPLQTIVWEIIKEFNFSAAQSPEVIKLMQAANGSQVTSSTHRIINNRGWLIIAPLQTQQAQHIVIEKGDNKIVFEDGTLHVDILPAANIYIATDASVAMFDAAHIRFPLILRKWKQGDYFYPLGMQKKKKLSRFFIDQKLSPPDKEKVWVLEINKKIAWVVGMRIDDRCKITSATQKICKVQWFKS
ncbi:MAG TPA: tRNA lysidine(34) synthetase TilS [Chitinophagaceae bacterium]|nr:tRNA lysidine(34) synthetase TilS [Chitinophagaceae bacterium]